MTRVERTARLLDAMQEGLTKLPFPLASFRAAQLVQVMVEQCGWGNTLHEEVKNWFVAQGYSWEEYGIGYRVSANKATQGGRG